MLKNMNEGGKDSPTPKFGFKVEKIAEAKPAVPMSAEETFDFDIDSEPKPIKERRLEPLPPDKTIGGEVEKYVKENPQEKRTIANPKALLTALLEARRREQKDK